jgi:hypothetical protein
MRRMVITLGILAILASSCGGNGTSARLAETLQDRVASIRELAEAGKPGLALSRLRNIVTSVSSQLDAGQIDESWALEILGSAQEVELQLRLLRASPSETDAPSPSPVDEGGGEENSGGGKDKDKDGGNGDEGHGND